MNPSLENEEMRRQLAKGKSNPKQPPPKVFEGTQQQEKQSTP